MRGWGWPGNVPAVALAVRLPPRLPLTPRDDGRSMRGIEIGGGVTGGVHHARLAGAGAGVRVNEGGLRARGDWRPCVLGRAPRRERWYYPGGLFAWPVVEGGRGALVVRGTLV